MPRLSRWFIKAGLIYFVISLLLAIGLKVSSPGPIYEFFRHFTPVYFHLLLIGWITQIIIGVSLWMFPRHTRDNPRGNEFRGWLVFILLNAGLILRSFSEPLMVARPADLWSYMLIASAILQWGGGILYIDHIWRRVKGK